MSKITHSIQGKDQYVLSVGIFFLVE
jgi:hypothetical protein